MTVNLDDWGAVARAVLLWLPAVIALAWLASRLLGVKMSWSRTIIAGIIGAGAGGALAKILAEEQHGAGFDRNLWIFTFVFTMSAVTWMALLSRPGTLARAQTGLARLPRPVKAAKRKGQRVARYAQITRIAARHGLGPALGFGRSRADDGPATSRQPSASAGSSRTAAGSSSSSARWPPPAQTCSRRLPAPNLPSCRIRSRPRTRRRSARCWKPSWAARSIPSSTSSIGNRWQRPRSGRSTRPGSRAASESS